MKLQRLTGPYEHKCRYFLVPFANGGRKEWPMQEQEIQVLVVLKILHYI